MLNWRWNGESKFIAVNIAHPGFVNAPGITRHIRQSMGNFAYQAGKIFMRLVALNIHQGALTQLYLASAEEIETKKISGQYFGPVAIPYEIAEVAKDDEMAGRLWKFSEELVSELLK